jgi:hypothetical protein
MKRQYKPDGECTYTSRRPYEKFSYWALEQLLSHANGSEEREVIERELRFRQREPKEDPRQTPLFTGTEWAVTRSPWMEAAK